MEKISVIIPSYNSSGTIRACVLSVLETGYRPLEVIVVDDVSTDDSPAIVEDLCAQYPDMVRLERMEINGGPTRARNEGARRADGAYYFFTDSDTAMEPHTLENFARRMDEADAVVGLYHWRPLNEGAVAWYKALLNHQMFSRHGVIPYEVFNGAAAGIRAEVFDDSGGYNENLGWGMDYENEELGHRLFRDYRMVLDPGVMVRHAFPGFGDLTRTYFSRVSLWMELFMRRGKFEEGGTAAADTGVATVAAPAALVSLPLGLVSPALFAVPLFFLAVYLYGYGGFLAFVLRKRPGFLPLAFILSIYFSTVIAAGAAFGALRVLTGNARVQSGTVTKPS